MKAKYLLIGVAVLLAAVTIMAGRLAWRARHQLVSVDVRNMPLEEVLRKVERQTRKKIRAQQALNARITLHVHNKPLAYVLDRIAEQAGAHWSTLYAVHDSPEALRGLDSALRTDGKLEPAGWSKLAPHRPEMDGANVDGDGLEAGPAILADPSPDLGPPPGQRRMIMVRRENGGPVVFFGGPKGQMEVWSPEQLVIETRLGKRLGNDHGQSATAEAAADAARKLNAKWTTYFAFSKSAMGIGFSGQPRPGSDPLQRSPNDRFARLTPEQRVLRARERMGLEPAPNAP
jgi:hypothetical protein